jgi:hypothetical protein
MEDQTALVLSILTLLASQAAAQSEPFDFDSVPCHTPLLVNLTVAAVTASFSGTGQSYSIERANAPGFTPAGFAGNCLCPNSVLRSDLLVSFSRALQDIDPVRANEMGCDASARIRITGHDASLDILDRLTASEKPESPRTVSRDLVMGMRRSRSIRRLAASQEPPRKRKLSRIG